MAICTFMTAALQPNFSVKSFPVTKRRSTSSSRQTASRQSLSHTAPSPIYRTQQVPQSHNKAHNKVVGKLSRNHDFIKEKQTSVRLKPLFVLQRVALGIGSLLMVSSAVVYIYTVPIPQVWSQEYEQLKSLQRQARELTAANETLKNNIVRQAQQEAQNSQQQLSYLQPEDVIVLKATKVNSESSIDSQDNYSPFQSIPLSY